MDAASMRRRCPESRCLGVGCLTDYQLVFTDFLAERHRGGADILPQNGAQVWGLLYELSEVDLNRLDANKVYPAVYERFPVHIQQPGGTVLENVWTYALRDKPSANYPPTQAYRDLLIQAATDHQFPESYLAYLRAFATRN